MQQISKTTLANVCAGVIVIGGFAYAVVTNNAELVKTMILVGLGYLFGYTGGIAAAR